MIADGLIDTHQCPLCRASADAISYYLNGRQSSWYPLQVVQIGAKAQCLYGGSSAYSDMTVTDGKTQVLPEGFPDRASRGGVCVCVCVEVLVSDETGRYQIN